MFKLSNAAAERRLPNRQKLRCLSETSMVRSGNGKAKMLQVHI